MALSGGLVSILGRELGFEVLVPERPELVAAVGAAILAQENIEKDLSG